MHTSFFTTRHSLLVLSVAAAFLLASCGGGGQAEDDAGHMHSRQAVSADSASTAVSPSPETIAHQKEGARRNAAELEGIAKTGVLPQPFDGPLLSGAEGSTAATLNTPAVAKSLAEQKSGQKSAASRVPAYRFFNSRTGAHFYTTSETERANVIATLPQFSFEGPAFSVSATSVAGLSPVHRFFNRQTGVHFYTISESERASVVANLPQFNYEGVGYYASTLPGTGYTPLYRFFYAARGFHFYTNSLAERDNVIATLPQYSYEGVGYYVLGSDWQTPAVPHTGITQAQCYRPDSNTLVTCLPASPIQVFPDESLALNPQQDGHRTNTNPMSYGDVANPISGVLTTCVRDTVTGLIWERKDAGGLHAVGNTYTSLNNNATTDASGFVIAVNAEQLCGFSDWRLPTVEELYDIVNFGVQAPGQLVSNIFFATIKGNYLTSSRTAPGATRAVNFESGQLAFVAFSTQAYVRLVRGAPWSGQRYMVTSASYPSDSANNAVIDRRTGLTWRRCVEGQRWSGSACLNSGVNYSHQNALSHAKNQAGWRLPNIKELSSLSDFNRSSPAMDPVYFPGAISANTWSSTPYVSDSVFARSVFTGTPAFDFALRSEGLAVRLVGSTP